MKKTERMVAVFALFLLLAGCAAAPEPPAAVALSGTSADAGGRGVWSAGAMVVTAVVDAVDLKTREVVLRGSNGKRFTLVAGPEVRNLPQVKVGDRLTVEYFEAVALEIAPSSSGPPDRTEATSMQRAPLGQKPGGSVSREVVIQAVVESIDRQERRVTVRGPNRTVSIKVPPEKDLERLSVGDTVWVTFVEAVAVAVSAPQ